MESITNMKSRNFAYLALATAALAYVVTEGPLKTQAEKKRRAELYMLETVQSGISEHLEAGGGIPTNWLTLSNSVRRWDLVLALSEPNHFIPTLAESYIVLARPAPFTAYPGTNLIFLVGAKPRAWPASERGRWIVFASSNYHVFRSWMAEKELPPDLRSQPPKKPN